jgi:polyisoprenoid-binding protein YceI
VRKHLFSHPGLRNYRKLSQIFILSQREETMQKILLFLIAIAMLLAACSSQPAAQETSVTTLAVQPTQVQAIESTATQQIPPTVATTTEAPAVTQPSATEQPISTEQTPATEQPAVQLPASGGPVVYKIVPGESSLQYEVGETFLDGNRFNTALGVTPQVQGEISVDPAAPQNSNIRTITADISQFASDSGRRDNALRERFLESSAFPMVTFVPTSIEGLPATYQEGQEIPLKISGDLTIRDVTRPVTFDAVVKVANNELTGQATTTFLMSDFGIGPISVAGILNTEDQVKITMNIVARP